MVWLFGVISISLFNRPHPLSYAKANPHTIFVLVAAKHAYNFVDL